MNETTTVFTKYSKTVPTLSEAWEFVMNHVDNWDEPSVEISPIWVFVPGEDEADDQRFFEVSVSGHREDE